MCVWHCVAVYAFACHKVFTIAYPWRSIQHDDFHTLFVLDARNYVRLESQVWRMRSLHDGKCEHSSAYNDNDNKTSNNVAFGRTKLIEKCWGHRRMEQNENRSRLSSFVAHTCGSFPPCIDSFLFVTVFMSVLHHERVQYISMGWTDIWINDATHAHKSKNGFVALTARQI